MWEFTITIDSLDYYSYSSYGNATTNTDINEAISGLRVQITKIAKSHTVREGRNGARFERGVWVRGLLRRSPC